MKNRTKLPTIYLTIILLLMYVPIVVVVISSFNASKMDVVWKGFTLEWYQKLTTNRQLKRGLKTSLQLATASSLSAAVLGTLGAVGLRNLRFRGKGAIDRLAMLPLMIPEIVLGIVFLVFLGFIGIPTGMLALYIGHTSFCVPYIYSNVKARLVGLDPSLEEAARDLGASPRKAFTSITLPSIMPAVLSGTLLAFAMSMDDVIISIFLLDSRVNTLPVVVYTQLKTQVSPEINALCTLMLAATLLVVLVAGVIQKRRPIPQPTQEVLSE